MLGLRGARAIRAIYLLLHVGHAVALRVLHKPQRRWLRDEHAAIHAEQPARQDEAVGEDGALVHLPIAVGVLQHDDATERLVLALAFHIVHVAAHFADEKSALLVP